MVKKHRQHTSTIHPCQQDRVVNMRSSCRPITSWSKVFLEQRFAGLVMDTLPDFLYFPPLFLRQPLRNFLISSLCGLEIILLPAAETKRLLAAKKHKSDCSANTGALFEVTVTCVLEPWTWTRKKAAHPSPSPVVETCNTVSTPAQFILVNNFCKTCSLA